MEVLLWPAATQQQLHLGWSCLADSPQINDMHLVTTSYALCSENAEVLLDMNVDAQNFVSSYERCPNFAEDAK